MHRPARGVQLIARELSFVPARLLLFRSVFADDVGRAWLQLVEALADGESDEASAAPARRRQIADAYGSVFALLAAERAGPDEGPSDPWQRHLIERIVDDDNPFAQAASHGAGSVPDSLAQAAAHDLALLETAFSIDGATMASAVARTTGWPTQPWTGALASPNGSALSPERQIPSRSRLKAALVGGNWTALVGVLAAHYQRSGSGAFGRYHAFRWTRRDGNGRLEPIATPDPIALDELVAYDTERALLLANTAQFVAGYPANNVLIYGDRGTGKSSTIKALANAHAADGLRLIEVHKQHLADYSEIIAGLAGLRERFILFVDDLSFDEHETEYKALKAVLEGGVEARPANVVLYATSNRRHLVQERFSDRGAPDDDVHAFDGLQEKLSLSDRFGITITFLAPDQERYLRIVRSLAARRALALDGDALDRRALQWAAWHNGRSGRCARQFVDHLAGELALRRASDLA